MPTTHPRRASPLKPRAKKASSAVVRTPAWLESHIRPVRDILRMKEYSIMGRLSFVSILKPGEEKARLIDLRQEGPFVAEAKNVNQVLLISEWTGIPPHIDNSQQIPCPDCQRECEFCKGTKDRVCSLQYCGGRGKRYDPAGLLDFSQEEKCPSCQGTGRVKCDGCQATGRRSTGILHGELYDADRRPPQPVCPKCKGRKVLVKETAVNILDFLIAQVGPFSILGEIQRFTVIPKSGKAAYQYDVLADGLGDGMFLVIEAVGKPSFAYLVGGIAIRKDVSR
jgi:hypothetical protein